MMREDLKGLRHSKEGLYGKIVLVAGAIVWALVAIGLLIPLIQGSIGGVIIFAVEIGAFILAAMLVKMFYRAYLFGHAILISEQQFPHLHHALKEGAAKLGIEQVPQAFLYNSNGLMNAFALRVSNMKMVLLTSALVDVESDEQIDFVIGHELGHHAAGHLDLWMNVLKFPGLFLPFIGTAYHRARELTADRIGAYCVGDLEASRGALHMLACGSARFNTIVNPDAFSAQEAMVPPITGLLLHIFSPYPRLTRRVREVEAFFTSVGQPGQTYRTPVAGAANPAY